MLVYPYSSRVPTPTHTYKHTHTHIQTHTHTSSLGRLYSLFKTSQDEIIIRIEGHAEVPEAVYRWPTRAGTDECVCVYIIHYLHFL
jgi:hypothetical protein